VLRLARSALSDATSCLIGMRCWGFRAGRGTGSHIVLDFGLKVPAARAIRNPTLTPIQRRFRGEVSIFVTCTWRLDACAKVICGSADSNLPAGEMMKGLRSVVGRQVRSIRLCPPAHDLDICFGDRRLRIFCDHTVPGFSEDNYSVERWKRSNGGGWSGELVVVSARGQVTRKSLAGATIQAVDSSRRPRLT
jgi:hypothetical protein